MNNPDNTKSTIKDQIPSKNDGVNPPTNSTVTAAKPESKPIENENVPPIDTGINLIPTLTQEQVVTEEKKKKLNVGSIVSLLILVVVSILIVGFNIISQIQVNNEKKILSDYENKLQSFNQKIIASDEIVDRVLLYQDIEGKSYSAKAVVEYLNSIVSKSGNATITKFVLGNDLSFTITGSGSDLENIAKLWYLLSNDGKISEVTLKSVSSTSNKANFSFVGKMALDSFLNSTD